MYMSINNNIRKLWIDKLLEIIEKPLYYLSKLEFDKFTIKRSPNDNNKRDINLGYLECFARIFSGISPWLIIEKINDDYEYNKQQLIMGYILTCFENLFQYFDEKLNIFTNEQSIVESAFICYGFIISKNKIWEKITDNSKYKLICIFKKVRLLIKEWQKKNNWYLFHGIIESFFRVINIDYDNNLVQEMIINVNSWYRGDGFYSDGPSKFKMDYYNSYVIQPFYIEILKIFKSELLDIAIVRSLHFTEFLERIIGEDGSFPPLGRSIVYRFGVFHLLSYCIYNKTISNNHSYGQLRNALTKVLNKIINKDIFNDEGFLELGFNSKQENISDSYSNTGSCYLTVIGFIPLGLSESDIFWSEQDEIFTQEACWKYKKDFKKYIIIKE